jgi:hypothetical protein
MPMFVGGPRDGQMEYDPEQDQPLPPELLARLEQESGGAAGSAAGAPMGGGGAPAGSAAQPLGDEEEGELLDGMLTAALRLAGGNSLSEQNKQQIQQAMSLLQKIKAEEERDGEQMMQGKVSPSMMRQASQTAGQGRAQAGY